MAKFLWLIALSFILSGCAHQLSNDWVHNFINKTDQPNTYNFDWKITGDDNVSPLQVFDNGKKTWLQYSAEQQIPAIFAKNSAGSILLRPKKDGNFLVLDRVPEKIVLRGGIYKAEIINQAKKTKDTLINKVHSNQALTSSVNISQNPILIKPPINHSVEKTIKVKKTNNKLKNNSLKNTKLIAKPVIIKTKQYSVSPADGNIRKALKRWVKSTSWTFSDEHWAADVDIPLAGSASFGSDFRLAVTYLLAATELGDRPLQACFYANKVLRVIPLAQRCDRTVTQEAQL